MAATQALAAKQGAMTLKGTAAFKGTAAKALPSGNAILAGKSLGLGLGLGIWGPVILGVVGAAAIYGYVRSRNAENIQSDEEIEIAEAAATEA